MKYTTVCFTVILYILSDFIYFVIHLKIMKCRLTCTLFYRVILVIGLSWCSQLSGPTGNTTKAKKKSSRKDTEVWRTTLQVSCVSSTSTIVNMGHWVDLTKYIFI